MKTVHRFAVLLSGLAICWSSALHGQDTAPHSESTLHMVVMDPMSLPLSCACVDGVGQRRYELLSQQIQDAVEMKVNLVYEESLQLAIRRGLPRIDVVIGKRSVVLADANATKLKFREVAGLSNRRGKTDLRGVVLVRKNDRLNGVHQLAGKKVAIASPEHAECHAMAKDLLRSQNIDAELVPCGSIEAAVYAFADREVDAVVVTDYMPPLLEACGKLDQNASETIATTKPCPGVEVFLSTDLDAAFQDQLTDAIMAAGNLPAVKDALESRDGFVPAATDSTAEESVGGWTDWRGPNRTGQHSGLPRSLGDQPDVLWRSALTGPAMAGISATEHLVVVADKSADFKQDLFRAFDAATGKLIWEFKHDADGRMEYTNAPRATPVIVANRVLLQNAFGKLFCVDLDSGDRIWERDFVAEFGGEVPTWGYSVPPLVIGDHVVVAPGSASASVVALDLHSGQTLWKTKGHAPAYAPFIFGSFGGRSQVIGYDAAGLGGWDLSTGTRLWELIPPDKSDFNVGTPIAFQGGLLVATENNAMRWYGFESDGKINPQPAAVNADCAPDTCTPVVVADGNLTRVFCTAYGELFCIEGAADLPTIWSETDDRFYDHTCLIAGSGRVLLWGSECDLLLLDANADDLKIVSQWRPMGGEHPESMSHPAIVGDHLYLRSQFELVCIRLPSNKP